MFMLFKKKYVMISILLLFFLSIGFASANDNSTQGDALNMELDSSFIDEAPIIEDIESTQNESSQGSDELPTKIDTKIEAKDVKTYYKEDANLVSYLKDADNNPVSNKNVSIFINNKFYDKITDSNGKIVLNLNLKPNTYKATIKFAGDDNYTATIANAIVKVNKASLAITTKNYKTYWESDLFFKAKVINKITKNPVKGVTVAFKVYKNNKYRIFYAATDAKGVASLRKNFKVGSYNVVTSIKKNKYIKSKSSKATLTIKPTAETGCSSLYVQVSNSEAVSGFRRDATNAKTLNIVKYKIYGKTAVKQYKTNSYFFHMVVTADGWMFGTGGVDDPDINHAIENLAGKMAKVGKIDKSSLKKIQNYEKILSIGHFSIKAPNGKYALVWGSEIKTGKLKPGEYLCVPNGKYCFRHGTWDKFSKDPVKAAVKIAATDYFGVNRRDVTAFHWKALTNEGVTKSSLMVYAANDDGHLVGSSTGYLKDDIRCKGKFISKDKLPKTPSKMLIGAFSFGSIDELIKIQTLVKVPKLAKYITTYRTLDITVKDKLTKKPIKNLILNIKIGKQVFAVKTNALGVAKFNTKSLKVGDYAVKIYSANIYYYVLAKTAIKIFPAPVKKTNNAVANKTNADASTGDNVVINGTGS